MEISNIMLIAGSEFSKWKSRVINRDVEREGFKSNYRILDSYTLLNTKTGNRIFPLSIEGMKMETKVNGNGELIQTFLFTTCDNELGFLMYPERTQEATICKSFFLNCQKGETQGYSRNQNNVLLHHVN